MRDGDAHIQVAVSREDHGYAVELRAPRELVPELRALRAELESALSGEGEEHDGLASFHAGPDDGDADDARPEDQEGWRSAGPEDDQARRQQPNPTARKRPALINRPVPDPARLLDRRA